MTTKQTRKTLAAEVKAAWKTFPAVRIFCFYKEEDGTTYIGDIFEWERQSGSGLLIAGGTDFAKSMRDILNKYIEEGGIIKIEGANPKDKVEVPPADGVEVGPRDRRDRERLIIRGTHLPICPKCLAGNAMLEKTFGYNGEEERLMKKFVCRDCAHELEDIDCELVFTVLEEEGRGDDSVWIPVHSAPAEDPDAYKTAARKLAELTRKEKEGEKAMTTVTTPEARRTAILETLETLTTKNDSPLNRTPAIITALKEHHSITVSPSTLRRDLAVLVKDRMVVKTEGRAGNVFYNLPKKAVTSLVKAGKKNIQNSKAPKKTKAPKQKEATAVVILEERDVPTGAGVQVPETAKGHWHAWIDNLPKGVVGCPLGRSFSSGPDAIADLKRRIFDESGIFLNVRKIVEKDLRAVTVLPKAGKEKKAKKEKKAPAPKKSGRISRIDAIGIALAEGLTDPAKIISRADDAYVAAGGTVKPKETAWYYKMAEKLFIVSGVAKLEDGQFILLK